MNARAGFVTVHTDVELAWEGPDHRSHVAALERITGSERHAALGTDLGGFIQAAPGLEDAATLAALELRPAVAAGNALRLLRATFASHEAARQGRRLCNP